MDMSRSGVPIGTKKTVHYWSINTSTNMIQINHLIQLNSYLSLTLRDSIFVSKMLLNSEVWHAVTKNQIEDLTKLTEFY